MAPFVMGRPGGAMAVWGRLLDHRGIGPAEAAIEIGAAEATVEALTNRLQQVGNASAAERAVRQAEREDLKREAAAVTKAIEAARRKLTLHRTGGGW